MKHKNDFYSMNIRVAVRDVLTVLRSLGLLNKNMQLDRYPDEAHGVWEK